MNEKQLEEFIGKYKIDIDELDGVAGGAVRYDQLIVWSLIRKLRKETYRLYGASSLRCFQQIRIRKTMMRSWHILTSTGGKSEL